MKSGQKWNNKLDGKPEHTKEKVQREGLPVPVPGPVPVPKGK